MMLMLYVINGDGGDPLLSCDIIIRGRRNVELREGELDTIVMMTSEKKTAR